MAKVTLFSQIISKIDRSIFNNLVIKHDTDKHNKGFNSWSHLISMMFCHFAASSSVRDISNGLKSATGNLNHLGGVVAPSKSTLSYQNKNRSCELFKELYYKLLDCFGQHVGFKQVKFKIKSKILLLDATTISLCLSAFDWARYRRKKGAVKMHTLLDYDSCLPSFVYVSDGKLPDNKGAKKVPVPPGAVVVADRFYMDFNLLNVWDSTEVFFVVRHRHNLKFETKKELELSDDKHQHILKDEIVILTGLNTKEAYSKPLRRVVVWDEKNKQTIELITNHFKWSPNTISELYKSRWQIEIFFREIKQHLRIKSFIGTSKNAVMTQIWTALITILILKVLKAKAKYAWHLSNLVAFIRINLFVKIDLQQWLNHPFEKANPPPENYIQGALF